MQSDAMQADLVLTGANVVTMTGFEAAGRALSIAVKAGRILAVGPDEEIAPLVGPTTIRLDLTGKTVLPGFIDSHVHFTQAGLGSLGPSVYDVVSADAVLACVRQAVDDPAQGPALLIHGCAIGDLDRPVTRRDLDAISAAKPILIGDVGAHACIANSAALDLIALPDGIAGVGRDADGAPDGVLKDKANTYARYQYYSRAIDDETRVLALHSAAQMAASVGITTVHALEGGSPGRGWLPERDVEILLREQDRLPVRILVYFQSTEWQKAVDWNLPRIGGCIWVDGAYDEGTAALTEPYCHCPHSRGSLYFADDELDAFVLGAHRAGLQISLHAIGDAAIEQVLNAYERAQAVAPRPDPRHRIEHFSLPSAAQIERAARLGVAVGMQPNFATVPDPLPKPTDEPAGLVKYLGFERYQRRHPYRKIVDAGVLVAGGSDADPKPMGPLVGIQCIANHPERDRRLTTYEALALYTVNGARIAFEEHEKGTIEIGKVADFVVLGSDPLTTPTHALSRIPVERTIVRGRVVHERVAEPAA